MCVLTKEFLDEKLETINSALKKITDSWLAKNNLQKSIYEAATYSLLAGGKRLRPLFLIASGISLGCQEISLTSTACALEFIHTYSLIHDDLPSMDNDDLRRGKPTLHKIFPESHAILAGDFLLTKSFELISNDIHLNDHQKIKLIGLISKAIGDEGMIGGQILDIESENKRSSVEEITNIHLLKTGALITASIVSGAIIGNKSDEEIQKLTKFGNTIGLAFQIIDDILDVTKDSSTLGKSACSDIKNNKSTYVSTVGLEASQLKADHLFFQSKEILRSLNLLDSPLFILAKRCIERNC